MIRAADRIVGTLAFVVLALVAFDAVPVARRLRGTDEVAAPIAMAPAPPVDLSALRRFAPFGRAAAAAMPGDPASLGLQLRGILLARPAADSVALIAAAGGPAKGYTVGATLPGGTILDSVEFDLVVLRADGQLVTIALPTKPAAAEATRATAVPTVAGPDADPVAAHLAQEPAQDRLTLLGSLNASAGPDGFRVGPTLTDELRRAGLQPGDIIEKIDGAPIGNPEHDRAVFDNAVVAGRMRVDVVRGGRPVGVTIPLH